MNIVKISGSIGEQMFQYAFFMRLAETDHNIMIDIPENGIIKMFPNLPLKKSATPQQVRLLHKSISNTLLNAISKTQRIGKDFKETGNSYNADALTPQADAYFDGKWMSYRYFEPIADKVKHAFTVPVKTLANGSQSLIKLLEKERESVAIHIHRPTSKQNTCTSDYYNWAIAHIRHFIENPFFVIITDDVKWAESNLVLSKEEYICINAPAHSHYSVISLFNHAKHNIISNTLESWWAAWLNPNPDKIVIAPQKWSNTEQIPDLIPLYWISVPTT